MPKSRYRPHARVAAFLLLTAVACGDAGTGPDAGVDLDALFAPPTQQEIDAVLADWAARNPQPDLQTVGDPDTISAQGTLLEVRIVLQDPAGARVHTGIVTPVGAQAGSLPVLLYLHGGDGGIDLDETLPLLPFVLGDSQDDFVFVAPSFRSEPLVYDGVTFPSTGDPSPWDRDVDDAIVALDAALLFSPAADSGRVGALGFSRGAGVGLLMAERDPRVDVVIEFFGPTDLFGPFARGVVEDALRGRLPDLPGVSFLDERFIQPLARDELTVAEVRREMLRRSAVYFADRLPQLQVHHGREDEVVPVEQAERLIEAMQGLGREEPGFEFFLYEGGTHDPLSLPGSLPRARAFAERLSN